MTKYNLYDWDSEYNDNEKDVYNDFVIPDEELEKTREENNMYSDNKQRYFFTYEDMNFILDELNCIFNIKFRMEFNLIENKYKVIGFFKEEVTRFFQEDVKDNGIYSLPYSCEFKYYDGDEYNLNKVVAYIARKLLEERLDDIMEY